MILYALLHKASGKYMPAQPFTQSGSGYTYWEPLEKLDKRREGKAVIPRLFNTKNAAAVAKSAWENGPHWRKRLYDTGLDEWYTNPQPQQPTPEHPRKTDDLTIVAIELKELQQ
jgi:hypothetical protein